MRCVSAVVGVCALAGVGWGQSSDYPDFPGHPGAGVEDGRVEVVEGWNPELPVVRRGDPEQLAEYRVEATRFQVRMGEWREGRSYRERPVAFPSPLSERWPTVHATYYVPREHGGRLPAAVVVHHLGGSFEAEAFLARHLAQNGMAALFVSLPNYGLRREPNTRQGFLQPSDPIGSLGAFRQAALDVVRAGDALRAMPEVDPTRIAATGVSLGAIVTGLARGVDPRFGHTALILGGGDLARLMLESPEVEEFMEGVEVDYEELRGSLAHVDPVTFAGRIETEELLMFNARRDEVIPADATLAFWDAAGRPPIEWLNCGHYGAVLHLPRLFVDVLDHLRATPSKPID